MGEHILFHRRRHALAFLPLLALFGAPAAADSIQTSRNQVKAQRIVESAQGVRKSNAAQHRVPAAEKVQIDGSPQPSGELTPKQVASTHGNPVAKNATKAGEAPPWWSFSKVKSLFSKKLSLENWVPGVKPRSPSILALADPATAPKPTAKLRATNLPKTPKARTASAQNLAKGGSVSPAPAPIPEPSTFLLFGLVAVGLATGSRFTRRARG